MAKFKSIIDGAEYTVEADTQEEADAFARQAHNQGLEVGASVELEDIAVTPASGVEEEPPQEPSMLEKVGDVFTGNLRTTPEVEELPDWADMPELNQLTLQSARAGIDTALSNPEETMQILTASFPNMQVRQDAKGNYIFKSPTDGQEYAYKPGFRASDIPRAIGGVLAFTPASRAKSVLGQTIGSAATQGAIEASQEASGGQFNPEDVLMAGAIPAGIAGVAKTANVAKTLAQGNPLATPQSVANLEQAGVPIMTTDVIEPSFVGKGLQYAGERIPFVGTAGTRKVQQNARINAVEDILRDYGGNTVANAQDELTKSALATKSDFIQRYKGMKDEIIERNAQLGVVPVDNTLKAVNDKIVELSKDAGTPEVDKIISDLKEFATNVQGKDLKSMELQRKILGEKYKDPNLASIKSIAENITNSLYAPIVKDMGDFLKANGEPRDFMKWKVANQRLKESVGDLESSSIKRLFNKGEVTPEVIESALFSKKPSEVQILYKSLSQRGKSLAQLAILNRAYTNSLDKSAVTKEGVSEIVNPTKFVNELKKIETSTGVLFKGEDAKRLEGLVRVLNVTRRAQEAPVVTMSGQQTYLPILGATIGQIMGDVGGGIATAGALGASARIYESKPVRNLLINLAKTKEGSQSEAELVRKLNGVIQSYKDKGE